MLQLGSDGEIQANKLMLISRQYVLLLQQQLRGESTRRREADLHQEVFVYHINCEGGVIV